MKKIFVLGLSLVFVLLALPVRQSNAKPVLSRVKRISDQRLAELETLIALDKLKGKLITVPVGMGLDPSKIGRKRRADNSFLSHIFNTSDEDQDETEALLESEAQQFELLQRLQRLQHAQELRILREEQRDEIEHELQQRQHHSASSPSSSSSRNRNSESNSIDYLR